MENQENLKKEYIQEGEGENTIELSRAYGGIQHIVMREPTVQDLLTAELQSKGSPMLNKKLRCLQIFAKLNPILLKVWVCVIMGVFRIHIDFLHLKCK